MRPSASGGGTRSKVLRASVCRGKGRYKDAPRGSLQILLYKDPFESGPDSAGCSTRAASPSVVDLYALGFSSEAIECDRQSTDLRARGHALRLLAATLEFRQHDRGQHRDHDDQQRHAEVTQDQVPQSCMPEPWVLPPRTPGVERPMRPQTTAGMPSGRGGRKKTAGRGRGSWDGEAGGRPAGRESACVRQGGVRVRARRPAPHPGSTEESGRPGGGAPPLDPGQGPAAGENSPAGVGPRIRQSNKVRAAGRRGSPAASTRTS